MAKDVKFNTVGEVKLNGMIIPNTSIEITIKEGLNECKRCSHSEDVHDSNGKCLVCGCKRLKVI